MQRIGKTEEFLRNYQSDLTYNHKQEGVDSLNNVTCGTPEFETEEEAQKYLADLSTTIRLLESNT